MMLSQLLACFKDSKLHPAQSTFFLQLNIIMIFLFIFLIARSDIDRLTHRTATCTHAPLLSRAEG